MSVVSHRNAPRHVQAALCIIGATLAGCAHGPLVNIGPKAPAAQPAPATAICPGGISAPIPPEPQLPPDADFPAATTPVAAAAVGSASRWLTAHSQWGRDGWLRAQLAKDWCDTKR